MQTTKSSTSRIGIYARYSSQNQHERSIDDQLLLCHNYIKDKLSLPLAKISEYCDYQQSGSLSERQAYKDLIKDIEQGKIDYVVAEALDRLSRKISDISYFHEHLEYYKVGLFTYNEGEVGDLHIGLKGTMNAITLKDIKQKTRRSLLARADEGRAPAGILYGYRVKRNIMDDKNRPINGLREIIPEEAIIVQRIFEEYAAGGMIKGIIKGLNQDEIPSPSGGQWRATSLKGSLQKREGILLKELYVGVQVFNRVTKRRHPVTGKRNDYINPKEEWVISNVPHLRIIDDELWNKVQKRIELNSYSNKIKTTNPHVVSPPKENRNRKTKYTSHPLTGIIICHQCSGLKRVANDRRYVCQNYSRFRTCTNARGTKEDKIRTELFAILDKYITDYQFKYKFEQHYNIALKKKATLTKKIDDVQGRIDNLYDAIESGVDKEKTYARIIPLTEKLTALEAEMRDIVCPPVSDESIINFILKRALKTLFTMFHSKEHYRIIKQCFKLIISSIVLAPITQKKHGETIVMNLNRDPEAWAEFWKIIHENPRLFNIR